MSKTFSPFCEVVLHDLRDQQHAILAIHNNLSGRQPGALPPCPGSRSAPPPASMFSGSKLAHFNFVGDSVLGHGINLEAGSIVANYRNERVDKEVWVRVDGVLQRTGCDKFGALLGDQSRLGANAVLAPGAVLAPASVVGRGQVFDAEVSA